jgi:hypothetical protein
MYDGEKGGIVLGNAVRDQALQLQYLKNRLNMFLEVIESLDPETTDLEDIDRLIRMIDDLEMKYERFKKDWQESR